MTSSPISGRRAVAAGVLVVILAAGAWLRLHQFLDQVLLDDEWHAVHQLLAGKSPAQLFLFFGHADYSIPLGILYWFEARWFGLSEFGMRWPMLLAGLAFMVILPIYAWQQLSARVALVFASLLALSPILIIYSHTARPYSLTLLLAFFGLHAFYRYLDDAESRIAWGVLYSIFAASAIWLHLVMAPFVAAPFLLEGIRLLANKRPAELVKLVRLAIPSGLVAVSLVLPPLLTDAQSLAIKMGDTLIEPQTVLGALFIWFGTSSGICAAGLGALALIGIPGALQTDRRWQSALLGILLTGVVVLVARPAWAGNPLTFGRYLLPAIPVLLLASACGVERLAQWPPRLKWPALALSIALAGWYVANSPVWHLAATPNSHVTHSYFQFDFRAEHNRHAKYMATGLAKSPFWAGLEASGSGTNTVAVAPFYFVSYFWDAPLWERQSRHRVLPAFLTGYCTEHRLGEVPDNSLYRFRNVFYLVHLTSPGESRPDWLVFNQPVTGIEYTEYGQREIEMAQDCIDRLRRDLGEPDYEDEVLLAFSLSD